MAKNITPVPNGPLIKKKGPYAGSTLRSGGTIKKAQNGDTLSVKKPMTYAEKRAAQEIVKERNRRLRDSILNRNAAARGMTRAEVQAQQEKDKKKPDACVTGLRGIGKDNEGCSGSQGASERRVKREARRRNGGPVKKAQNDVKATKDSTAYFKNEEKILRQLAKSEKGISNVSKFNKRWFENKAGEAVTSQVRQSHKGQKGYDKNGYPVKKKAKAGAMIKRADGSMSRRGLWDNIRANKGSGKKPTKQMLVQEKKIKAKSKK
jgi:hypothetical protein